MTATHPPTSPSAESADLLAEITKLLRQVIGDLGLNDVEITMETSFHDDLELESIDLVTLAGLLAERYGERVNIAQFLADKELDEVIDLRVGQLVTYVSSCLTDTPGER